jgi:hypothetical protein
MIKLLIKLFCRYAPVWVVVPIVKAIDWYYTRRPHRG